MKAFSLFLAELNDGTTHAALTGDLEELFQQVKSTGRSVYAVLLGNPG